MINVAPNARGPNPAVWLVGEAGRGVPYWAITAHITVEGNELPRCLAPIQADLAREPRGRAGGIDREGGVDWARRGLRADNPLSVAPDTLGAMRLEDPYAEGPCLRQQQRVEDRTACLISKPWPIVIGTVRMKLAFAGMIDPHAGMTEEARGCQAGRRAQTFHERFYARVQRLPGAVAREGLGFQQCHGQACAGASDGGSGARGATANHQNVAVHGWSRGVTFGRPLFLRIPAF